MTCYCAKCSYNGPEKSVPHPMPRSGRPCDYPLNELEPISMNRAREILMTFGWDLDISQEPRKSNDLAALAKKIAEAIKEEYSVGTSSMFCDESDWDEASVDEVAAVIENILTREGANTQ